MGLHLNYELRLPARTSEREISDILDKLRDYASSLPFDQVSPVADAGDPDVPPVDRWQATIRLHASLVAEPFDEDKTPYYGDIASAQGFLINPGEGSESAPFGFMRRADVVGTQVDWHWQCFCKTQYASTVSDAHLVTCHTSLVKMLDRAIDLGIEVQVLDETHYWDTRDEQTLIEEVHKMNRLIAMFAGQLSDALGEEKNVVAPIFSHPRFERLEMGE